MMDFFRNKNSSENEPPQKSLNRRQFFRKLVRPAAYNDPPVIDPEACIAGKSDCRLCQEQCPFDALRFHDGKMQVSTGRCRECGLCAAVCPCGAVSFKSVSLNSFFSSLWESNIRSQSSGLMITCQSGAAAIRERMCEKTNDRAQALVFKVPCIAAVSHKDLLTARCCGVRAVSCVCPNPQCVNRAAVDRWQPVIDGTRQLAALMEMDLMLETVVRHSEEMTPDDSTYDTDAEKNESEDEPAVRQVNPDDPIPRDIPDLFSRLAGGTDIEDRYADDVLLPFFDVVTDKDRCMLCGSCARNCPTGALRIEDGETRRLMFTPADCVGCRTCVHKCPDQLIRLRRHVNPSRIMNRETLCKAEDGRVNCRKCGRLIANRTRLINIDRRLREKGFDSSAEALYLCDRCKRDAVFPFTGSL